VNHNHKVICNPNQYPPVCRTRFEIKTTNVITAPTSTTNMTGFFHITRGSNFQKESTIAVFNILRSVIAVLFACAVVILFPQNIFPAFMSRCSRIGPRLSAGKKVNAPTIKITQTSSTVNSGPVTGKVPRDSGTCFLAARFPAIARIGMIMKNRPRSMATPKLELYQSVLVLSPPKAEPLLPTDDVYAYRICDSPCAPGLVILDVPNFATTAIAEKIRMVSEVTSMVSTAIFTSN